MLLLLLAILMATGCGDTLTSASLRGRIALVLDQAGSTTPLDGERVDVSISGPGISPPIFGSFRFINDTARVELDVPLGRDRLVAVAIFDSSNTLIASGQMTIVVGSSSTVSVPVPIAPTSGEQPIIVRVGSTTVTVSPGSLTLAPNGTAQLSVAVTDQDGQPISGAVPVFASSNPSIASVSATGVVTGRVQGVTAVTVSALGVAARIPVSVSAAPLLRSP
ncbi:MAG: hypothetical protein C0503_01470 [Gemmatimonas sp.]|nr:hypothetical protein [Gemmatimonas sp.]